jgi:hypothetical protein
MRESRVFEDRTLGAIGSLYLYWSLAVMQGVFTDSAEGGLEYADLMMIKSKCNHKWEAEILQSLCGSCTPPSCHSTCHCTLFHIFLTLQNSFPPPSSKAATPIRIHQHQGPAERYCGHLSKYISNYVTVAADESSMIDAMAVKKKQIPQMWVTLYCVVEEYRIHAATFSVWY